MQAQNRVRTHENQRETLHICRCWRCEGLYLDRVRDPIDGRCSYCSALPTSPDDLRPAAL